MRVRQVRTSGDLAAFIDLPYGLHANDRCWVPPLRRDVRALLRREGNPFFEHGDATYFLAEQDGRVVGRIAAITNRLHNETHGDRVGFFGFFEAEDDRAAAEALLDAAAARCRTAGHDRLRGPVSFSVNHECGLLVDGFDTPPTLLMPHNPPYYDRLVRSGGLAPVKELLAFQGGSTRQAVPAPVRASRAAETIRRRAGVTLRRIDLRRLDSEIELVSRIYNACWSGNWGFVPLTLTEARQMARRLRPVLVADLGPIVEKDGEPVGFALAVPDLNVALRGNRSGRTVPGVARIAWSLWRKKIHRARVLLLGVRPEYRGRGIDALLWHWIWTRAMEHGYWWGEAGWILEENREMTNAAERMGFSRYKSYRLYERAL